MPCTPTGLSHSYIARWADLTMPGSLDGQIPSLEPIPSPAHGRGRTRRSRKDENESDECRQRTTCSPHPPVTRPPCNARTRVTATRRPAALPNPTLNFRRLAHKQPPPTQIIPRVPSDVTNKPTSTPSPDLIFTMSPVLGLDGLTTRRPSRLSAELTPSPTHGSWDQPPPPYSTSHATTSAMLADESSASVIDDLVAESMILPMRMHAKSDPLPARLSSYSTSVDTTPARPIPIPKPSPRVPSDYGGVSSVSVSVSVPKFARAPRTRAKHQDENTPLPLPVVEEPADVTGDWCGTADAVPVPVAIPQRPLPKKKRFFVGESYDGDMDSEWSSWR